jgi:hypothetical protein
MKEEIIHEIVDLEWEMFSGVNNYGGKATCQKDHKTFTIMRASQAEAWTENLLLSYLDDLVLAKGQGRNLMTEKYARMMESTHPEEYRKVAGKLPVVNSGTVVLIEKIIEINLKWKAETAENYPNLTKRGRAIYTQEDTYFFTSFETYLRGELRTFSPNTIHLYYDMTIEHLNRHENIEEIYLWNTVKHYGYDSLESAEKYASP